MNETLEWLYDTLDTDHGVPRTKLHANATLVHDLGVTGDDAGELLERIHQQFRTDFSALVWTDFFHNEGIGLCQGCLLMLGMGPGVFAGIWFLPQAWLEWQRMMLSMAAGLASLTLIGKFSWLLPWKFGEKRRISLIALAEIIDAGGWPEHPNQVT